MSIQMQIGNRDSSCFGLKRGSRVIYDAKTNNFQAKSSFGSSLCGKADVCREENRRTWEAFQQGIQQNYGVPLASAAEARQIDLEKKLTKSLSVGDFDDMIEWAAAVHKIPGRPSITIDSFSDDGLMLDAFCTPPPSPISEGPRQLTAFIQTAPALETLDRDSAMDIEELILVRAEAGEMYDLTEEEVHELVAKVAAFVREDDSDSVAIRTLSTTNGD